MVRTSFFGFEKSLKFRILFFETLVIEIYEKTAYFKIKHPDSKFGNFLDVKIERFSYKMKLNSMKKVPQWRYSKIGENHCILPIF